MAARVRLSGPGISDAGLVSIDPVLLKGNLAEKVTKEGFSPPEGPGDKSKFMTDETYEIGVEGTDKRVIFFDELKGNVELKEMPKIQKVPGGPEEYDPKYIDGMRAVEAAFRQQVAGLGIDMIVGWCKEQKLPLSIPPKRPSEIVDEKTPENYIQIYLPSGRLISQQKFKANLLDPPETPEEIASIHVATMPCTVQLEAKLVEQHYELVSFRATPGFTRNILAERINFTDFKNIDEMIGQYRGNGIVSDRVEDIKIKIDNIIKHFRSGFALFDSKAGKKADLLQSALGRAVAYFKGFTFINAEFFLKYKVENQDSIQDVLGKDKAEVLLAELQTLSNRPPSPRAKTPPPGFSG